MSSLEVQATGPFAFDPQSVPDALDLSLVLPTYNEASNITTLVEQLIASLDAVPGLTYEIIVVDDDSPDRTWEKALELAHRFPQVRALRRQGERGLSTAVLRGWQLARGQIFGVMDSDLQHHRKRGGTVARDEPRRGRGGGQPVHRCGGVSDWSVPRRMVSRCAQMIGLVVVPEVTGKVSDPMSGYFMIRREALEGRELKPVGYKILMEVLARGDVSKIAEVPYIFQEHPERASKLSAEVCQQYIKHLTRLRIYLLKNSSFVRFCIVGASGTLIDTAMLYLLTTRAPWWD